MNRITIAALAILAASSAHAREFSFVYTGTYGAADTLTPAGGGDDLLTGETPFRFAARFDDSSPDLIDGLPLPPFVKAGFSAYRPTYARLTIGGVEYRQGAGEDWAVAFFDRGNAIFPGFYGAGWIDEAGLPPGVGDGPGTVGDWAGSSPAWSADALSPFTLTGFRGAGYSSGPGCPMACTSVPFALVGPDGTNYVFQIAFRNEEATDGAFHSATLLPAPATLALFGLGAALAIARRRPTARPPALPL